MTHDCVAGGLYEVLLSNLGSGALGGGVGIFESGQPLNSKAMNAIGIISFMVPPEAAYLRIFNDRR